MADKLFYNVVFPVKNDLISDFVITCWHKEVGEEVTKGEPLYNIENDYFELEIPSPYSGVLIETFVAEKTVASVDTILARIETI